MNWGNGSNLSFGFTRGEFGSFPTIEAAWSGWRNWVYFARVIIVDFDSFGV